MRLRLTLLYGSLFLLTGALLLAITYELVSHATVNETRPVVFPAPPNALAGGANIGFTTVVTNRSPTPESRLVHPPKDSAAGLLGTVQRFSQKLQVRARQQIAFQRTAQLGTLLRTSGVALGIMAFVSIGLGWLMAGRALRPLRTMNARARGISERNLHERLALEGPDDELKELADTFDGTLSRLENAFESQRRFVANASHELRTPITLERTLVEVALADPEPNVPSLRDTCERVLAAGQQQERLIEALLTLARSQRGIERTEAVDLKDVTAELLTSRPAGLSSVRIDATLEPAPVQGDPALLERMIANLLDNAVAHNLPRDGWASVWTGSRGGRPTVALSNSGPVIPPGAVLTLLDPFRRLNSERTDHGRGLGLGLSIVNAIAGAHGAQLRAVPPARGGLEIEISFPPSHRPAAS